MLRSLENKVAWVTGAGTGIGEAGAIALAQAGMHVVLSGRRQEKLEEVASQCGDAVSIEMLDVADRDAVAEVPERAVGDVRVRAEVERGVGGAGEDVVDDAFSRAHLGGDVPRPRAEGREVIRGGVVRGARAG